MNDGYYDYVNGIPDAYRSALRTWIKDDRVTNINATTTLTKTLTFNVKGIDTNVVSATIPFTVTFSATFGGVLIEDDIAFTGPALG
jgi:hypothetical protein